jgi:hypothetical protein
MTWRHALIGATSFCTSLQVTTHQYWVGMYRLLDTPEKNTTIWRFVNGSQAPASAMPWCSGEPNNANQQEGCAVFLPGTNCMNDQPCWNTSPSGNTVNNALVICSVHEG